MTRRVVASVLACAGAVPATAVGLGPLSKSGITDGPAKAFYLTVYNPYPDRQIFEMRAIGPDDDTPQARVRVPAPVILGPKSARRVMIVAGGLVPGESYSFRLCAEKFEKEEAIHARVCSRITARRIAGGGSGA